MSKLKKIITDIQNVDKSIFGITKNEIQDRFSIIEDDNIEDIKDYVMHLQSIGHKQISERFNRIEYLHRIAAGQLNEEEIKAAKSSYDELLKHSIGIDHEKDAEIKIKNFPIINGLITSIVNKQDKMHTKVYAKAVNPEATSQFIDEQNKAFKNALSEEATKLFEMEIIDGKYNEEQLTQLRASNERLIKTKEKYLNFRHEVEVFCNHGLNLEEAKFDIKGLKRQVLEKILITNLPFIRVETEGSSYAYNVVKEHEAFFIKSDSDEDASEYSVFGTISFDSIDNVIGKYRLSEKDVNRLRGYASNYDLMSRPSGRVGDANEKVMNDITNLLYNLGGYGEFLHGIGNENSVKNLLRVVNINFKMPRKKGELTYVIEGKQYTKIVSSAYKMFDKGIYDHTWTKEKTKSNLIDGEHVDWYYEMETWTAIKIDPHLGSSTFETSPDSETVWVRLSKDEVQVKDPYKRYTSILPVHGGQSSSAVEKYSLVEKGIPYEEIYTFLGNRIEHLAATEIGLFFVLNQAVIPKESFDGSWEENPLLKWSQLAYDLGITLTSTDINQISGQNSLAMGQGYGQVVDLTKTRDIQNKLVLMQTIKREFYDSIGINQGELSELSPNQTTGSVLQGLQRSNNMLYHFYRRAEEIVRRARQTGIYYLKKFQEDNPKDISYSLSDKSNQVFRTLGEGFSISDVGVFFHDDINNFEKLRELQQYIMADNTMGADVFDKTAIMAAKTTTEIMDTLYRLKAEKEMNIEQQKEQEHQKQLEYLKQQETQMMKLEEKRAEVAALDRESNEKIASIRSLGYTNSSGNEVYDLIERLKDETNSDRNYALQERKVAATEKQIDANLKVKDVEKQSNAVSKDSLDIMRIKQREKEIEATKERTKALIELSRRNKDK
jgi:hypothetical protein